MLSDFERAINKCIFKLEPYSIQDGIEYYFTISRDKNKNWEGWKTIDSYKDMNQFPEVLDSILYLKELVGKFYKFNYWDKLDLDNLDITLDNKIKILSSSIKFGVPATIKLISDLEELNNSLKDKYNNDSYYYWKMYDLLEAQLLLKLIKSIPKKNAILLLENFL